MKDDGIPVRITAGCKVADARVPRFADEVNALRFEFRPSLGDIHHPHRKAGLVRDERQIFALWLPKAQGHVRRLDFILGCITFGEPENISVPGECALDVPRRDRNEVHLLDAHSREATTGAAQRQTSLPDARVHR